MIILYAAAATFAATLAARLALEFALARSIHLFIKVLLVMGFSAVFTSIEWPGLTTWVTQWYAAAGLAQLLHRLHRFLGAVGDSHRLDVLQRGRGR